MRERSEISEKTNKLDTETQRVLAEAERLLADTEPRRKETADIDRMNAETERMNGDIERTNADIERSRKRTAELKAEAERLLAARTERLNAETERLIAEAGQMRKRTAGIEAETERRIQENESKTMRKRVGMVLAFVGIVLYFGVRLNEAAESDRVRNEAAAAVKATTAAIPSTYEPGKSYEQSVADAWKDAERGNREVDKAMDDMIESYRRRAVSWDTSAGSGSRIDTFHMPSGEIVFCRTTIQHNRVTVCK